MRSFNDIADRKGCGMHHGGSATPRLKGLGNRLCDVVAGRTTHPVSLQVGGVAGMLPREQLLSLRDGLARSFEDIGKTADLLRTFKIPAFERETEFVALRAKPSIRGSTAA